MSNAETFQALEDWYAARCDGAWEQRSGLEITTLDNPGWHISADLTHALDADLPSREISVDQSATDWLFCTLQDKKFEGAGDPTKLTAIVQALLTWTKTA
jgi:hypothetical protein